MKRSVVISQGLLFLFKTVEAPKDMLYKGVTPDGRD